LNTFLPYPDFIKSAQCLDYKRLGKQRVEAWQIYLALTKENYGWQNHPIVKQWRRYINYLRLYGIIVCLEWINRGYNDNLIGRFLNAKILFNKTQNQKNRYCLACWNIRRRRLYLDTQKPPKSKKRRNFNKILSFSKNINGTQKDYLSYSENLKIWKFNKKKKIKITLSNAICLGSCVITGFGISKTDLSLFGYKEKRGKNRNGILSNSSHILYATRITKKNIKLEAEILEKIAKFKTLQIPKWLGNKKFHSAMRSNLLRKDKKYYSKFGWKEKDNLPYIWVLKKEN